MEVITTSYSREWRLLNMKLTFLSTFSGVSSIEYQSFVILFETLFIAFKTNRNNCNELCLVFIFYHLLVFKWILQISIPRQVLNEYYSIDLVMFKVQPRGNNGVWFCECWKYWAMSQQSRGDIYLFIIFFMYFSC